MCSAVLAQLHESIGLESLDVIMSRRVFFAGDASLGLCYGLWHRHMSIEA